MYITLTSIRLRSFWHFFKLSYFGLQITLQARKEKGFIKMKNTGFGYMHYTASAWETEEDLKRFSHSGAHLAAMKQSRSIATEVRIYTFKSEKMPGWKETKQLLCEKGKVYSLK
jgi:hypothetical protein